MQKIGVSAVRLQMATLTVIALALGGCKIDSGTGSSTSAGQSSNGSMGTATLTWIAPAENTNGTPLTDLAGYHIHYGTNPDALNQVIDLAGSRSTEFEVIVSDNGSTDGSLEFIRKNYPQVRLLENGKNLRFAKANNVGIEASRGEYVLILNPDTIIRFASIAPIRFTGRELRMSLRAGPASGRLRLNK